MPTGPRLIRVAALFAPRSVIGSMHCSGQASHAQDAVVERSEAYQHTKHFFASTEWPISQS